MTCADARRAHHARLPRPVERRAQRDAWKRIVDFVHAQHATRRSRMQLGHAGAKGSTRVPWEGERPAARRDGNWPLISASPQQYLDGVSAWSRAMTRDDMDRVTRRLRARHAARRPRPASTGSSCTARTATCCRRSSRRSPTSAPTSTAARSTNRLRYPLEVFAAMRAVWPQRPADVGAHLGARLGRGRHHARRRGRDRARLQGRRRRPDRLLVGPGEQAAAAGLRPHVPDAVRRPHPQRGRHRDDGRRRDLRGRPRQQHHRRRPRRPVRRRPPAPGEPGVDAARGGPHRRHDGSRLAEAVPVGARRSSSATSSASKQAARAGLRRARRRLEQANRALGGSGWPGHRVAAAERGMAWPIGALAPRDGGALAATAPCGVASRRRPRNARRRATVRATTRRWRRVARRHAAWREADVEARRFRAAAGAARAAGAGRREHRERGDHRRLVAARRWSAVGAPLRHRARAAQSRGCADRRSEAPQRLRHRRSAPHRLRSDRSVRATRRRPDRSTQAVAHGAAVATRPLGRRGRAASDDHAALEAVAALARDVRTQIENEIRRRLREQLRHHAGALRLPGAAGPRARRPEDARAVALADGDRRQRHRAHRRARGARASSCARTARPTGAPGSSRLTDQGPRRSFETMADAHERWVRRAVRGPRRRHGARPARAARQPAQRTSPASSRRPKETPRHERHDQPRAGPRRSDASRPRRRQRPRPQRRRARPGPGRRQPAPARRLRGAALRLGRWTTASPRITLNRPERKNPLTFDSYAELRDLFARSCATPTTCKAVVRRRRRRQLLLGRRRARDHRPAGRG